MSSKVSLSPSRACEYLRCPLSYRFRAIDKLPEPRTEAQVKGTLTHAILEQMHKWPRPKRTPQDALAIMDEEWEKICEADPEAAVAVPEKELPRFFSSVREMVNNYFLLEKPETFDATACEMRIDATLGNGVPIKGFMDRVDVAPTGEVRIIDYKTGKKPIPRFSHDATFQMTFYALAYWRMYGVIPTYMQLMYLKVQDSMYLYPHALELEAFEERLKTIWANIEADGKSGYFEPKVTKLCDYCSFKEYCPAFDGRPPVYPGWPNDMSDEGSE
ncbi:MAG: RecB family exonuclease [Corynebacterium sp.]|nr:RecB family exonuclease [Corynebacterium sp.]